MCRHCANESQVARDIAAQARLETLLQLNPLLNRFALRVQVHNGCARLEGSVDHPALRQLACEIAQQADEVTRVEDRMTLERHGLSLQKRHPLAQTLRDLNTRAVIRLKYQLNRYTVDQPLDVDVCNDVARIVGRVGHARATEFARQLARDTVGIASVESSVVVCDELAEAYAFGNDLVPDGEQLSAQAGFMLALTRDLATLPLQVRVRKRQALLSGCVHTGGQLRKAENVVGAMIGVLGVDSRAVQLRPF